MTLLNTMTQRLTKGIAFTDPTPPDIADHVEHRLSELRQFAETCKASADVPNRELQSHWREVDKLKSEILQFKDQLPYFGPPVDLATNEARQKLVDAASQKIEEHEAEMTNLKIVSERAHDIYVKQMNVWTTCRDWWAAQSSRPSKFTLHTSPPGATVPSIEALADLRSQITQTKSQLKNLDTTLLPEEEVRTLALNFVKVEAKQASLTVGVLRPGFQGIQQHQLRILASTASPLAWFCKYLPDLVVQDIVAQAAKVPGAVMSSTDRTSTKTRLGAQLLMLEREEESMIQALHAEGHNAHRRIDATPIAVLGLAASP